MRARAVAARLALAGLVVVVGLASVALTWSTPARAQTTPGVQLELEAQTPWVATGSDLVLRLRGERVPAGLQLQLTLHESLVTRTAFDRSVTGGNLGSTQGDVLRFDWDALAVDASGAHVLAVGIPATGQSATGKLNARTTGVYPLEVQLREDQRTVTGFVTHVVVVAANAAGTFSVGQPLDVAWVWPLTAAPAYLPDGEPDPAVVTALRPGGRLGRQATALGNHTDIPLTLAPSPETLDSWNTLTREMPDLAAGLAPILGAGSARQVLTGPYVQLQLPSLLAEGFHEALLSERIAGLDTLQRLYASRLDQRTAVPGPLDAASLAYLRDRGVDRVIVEESALVPTSASRTPATPFVIETSTGGAALQVSAVASDAGLARLLTTDEPPALRAAHVLAGLAFVQREIPNSAPRGVVLLNPAGWEAPADLLDALLTGLKDNPLLRPVTVDQLFGEVSDTLANGTVITRDLAPAAATAAPITLGQYNDAARQRSSLESLLGTEDERVARAKHTLLAVLSAELANPDGRMRARRQLSAIGTDLGAFLAQIRVPTNSTITITSSRAEIPISLLNETGQRVTVQVRLQSDKLLFPEGAEREVVLNPRNSTVRFAVETRSAGTFPIVVTLSSADGGYVIQESRMKVRSTFVSGVGIFLTVGAISFLALWWGNDIRRRRGRALKSAAPPEPVS